MGSEMCIRDSMKMGYKVEVGDKIGYVVVKGGGRISSRVKPYILARAEEIDLDYYIDRQIVPAALRILEYFGVSEKQLRSSGRAARSLFDYARSRKK